MKAVSMGVCWEGRQPKAKDSGRPPNTQHGCRWTSMQAGTRTAQLTTHSMLSNVLCVVPALPARPRQPAQLPRMPRHILKMMAVNNTRPPGGSPAPCEC